MAKFRSGARNPRPVQPLPASFSATEAQNNFGQVLSRARREGRVLITRYDRPEAVVLSIEEYEALVREESVDLQALDREFDEMLAQMQRGEQRRAVDRLFSASAQDLGDEALRGRSGYA
jgi:prevent-host-death family protein